MEEKKKIKINLKTAVIIIFFIVALICTVFLVSSFSLKTTTENNLVNTVSQNAISINNTSETNSYYENMYTEKQLIEILENPYWGNDGNFDVSLNTFRVSSIKKVNDSKFIVNAKYYIPIEISEEDYKKMVEDKRATILNVKYLYSNRDEYTYGTVVSENGEYKIIKTDNGYAFINLHSEYGFETVVDKFDKDFPFEVDENYKIYINVLDSKNNWQQHEYSLKDDKVQQWLNISLEDYISIITRGKQGNGWGIYIYTKEYYENTESSENEVLDSESNKEDVSQNENAFKDNTFIGINGCFLGEYYDGKWYSVSDFIKTNYITDFKVNTNINVNYKEFKYQDILSKKSYYLYNASNNTILEAGEPFYNKEEYPDHYTDDIFYFRFDTKYDKYAKENEDYKTFISNKKIKDLVEIREIKNIEEYKKYVNEVLEKNNINEEGQITKILEVDSNKDGNKEIYIVAGNYETFMDDKRNVYNFVIKLENNESEVFIERIINKDSISYISEIQKYANITDINFVDFDNDGLLEMYIETITWDVPEIFVFDYNEKSELELCLYGCFAW